MDPAELTFNVTAKTYRYLDEEEQAPTESKDEKGKAKKDRKGKKKPAAGEA